MTVFEQTKYRLIRSIMDDTDEQRVAELAEYYDDNPLLYSVEELNESLCRIEQDLANGTMKFYTSEELRKHAV